MFGESKIASTEEYDIGSHESNAADMMHAGALGGTSHDASDMQRMGKKQELRVSLYEHLCSMTLLNRNQRNFRMVSIIGFVVVLQSTWESALLSAYFG